MVGPHSFFIILKTIAKYFKKFLIFALACGSYSLYNNTKCRNVVRSGFWKGGRA